MLGTYQYVKNSCSLPQDAKKKAAALKSGGRDVAYLTAGGKLCAIFGFAGALRPEVRESLQNLRRTGLRVMLLTGDSREAAEYTGEQAGVDKLTAQLEPLDKAELLASLNKAGELTAMFTGSIGGVPAAAAADIGIAAATAAPFSVKKYARIILASSDLRLAVQAFAISRRAADVVRRNLFLAFIFNILCLPVALGTGGIWGGPLPEPLLLAVPPLCSCLGIAMNTRCGKFAASAREGNE